VAGREAHRRRGRRDRLGLGRRVDAAKIIVRLPALSRFNTAGLHPGSDGPDGERAKDISVYTADPFPTMGGWKLVAQLQLTRDPADQVFTVTPADGRFIRVVITSASRLMRLA